jgi:predicted nucleic acid-binding protein
MRDTAECQGILERLHPSDRLRRPGIKHRSSGNADQVSRETFVILADSELTYREWRRLISVCEVRGKQGHDAHLVAAMKAQRVAQVLTFNTQDFAR